MRVREAEEGDELAPGGSHLTVVLRTDRRVVARMDCSEAVNGHRPSVDVPAASVAACCGAQALGVIMTGMGRDGAQGFALLRKNGRRVLAQDEASSAVFGMNKAVIDNGDADEILPLGSIAARRREKYPYEPDPVREQKVRIQIDLAMKAGARKITSAPNHNK